MKVRSVFTCCMIAAALLQASKCEGSLNEREIAAKAIFSGNEKIVSTITSDFIRKNHADSFGVTFDSTFANCNCITDQFADQLANEYDLVSLVQMKNEPQKCLEVVIDRLLNKNDRGVLHCLDGN